MTTFTELGSLLETTNNAGQTIRGLMELPASADSETPCVIIAPSMRCRCATSARCRCF